MLEDAQKLIYNNIVSHKEIEGTVNLLKNGLISVKFKREKSRIHFHNYVSILELLEVYETS